MEWLERVVDLRRWTQNGVRAPHKPLLLLYALGSYQRDADAELRYTAVEDDLKRLLAEYGPPNPTTPAYPFHHLVSDGVWEVHTDRGPGSPGAKVGELRSSGATGSLAPGLRDALAADPALLGRLVRVALDAHFPPSLHGDLCEAVGLDLERAELGPAHPANETARRQRDPRIRELVFTAYEYQCAFCGYDGALGDARLRTSAVGLEAVHVRWWSHDGPDAVDNGLCLCALHYKLFDKGVLGLGNDHRIQVSQRFVGRNEASRRLVLALAGQPVLGPQPGFAPVAEHHRAWHAKQVFRGAPRDPVLTPTNYHTLATD
ncbi:phosphorothioated DNA-binding restriction endonuclease [Streptomyces sp. NPDC090442]|uniref:phosphorothioated DNA-binding restriction endonuclease n=1 Tax=Streptomyces sp. NPDC090442 TaxID=3365962 RepID=UPI003823AFD9